TASAGHDLHSDRLRPGFCIGRTRPDQPAMALRRRICAVRPAEPYCNPVAPRPASSAALRCVARFDQAGKTSTGCSLNIAKSDPLEDTLSTPAEAGVRPPTGGD